MFIYNNILVIIIIMHYYEKNIVDIKQEYTEFLSHIITPLIYEGIKSMYNKSIEAEKKYVQMAKDDQRVKNPGILKIFQHFLKGIPALNINLIEAEMIRIRDSSKHADIFDKLIKSVMKSTIILLTYNASGQQCKLVNEKFHEKIDSKEFIHKIYVECAKQFYANPELFWHQYPSIELKRNQQLCFNIIDKSISIAIKQSIPINDVLDEYLKNDYIIETEEEKIQRLRNMINRNEEDNLNYFEENEKKVLITDNELNDELNDEMNEEINEEISKNIFDIDKLINNNTNNNTNQSEMVQTENQEQSNVKSNVKSTEHDFADKLAKVDLYSKSKKNIIRPQQNIEQNIEQPNLNKIEESDNIEIIKNKPVDERGFFNSMFNA